MAGCGTVIIVGALLGGASISAGGYVATLLFGAAIGILAGVHTYNWGQREFQRRRELHIYPCKYEGGHRLHPLTVPGGILGLDVDGVQFLHKRPLDSKHTPLFKIPYNQMRGYGVTNKQGNTTYIAGGQIEGVVGGVAVTPEIKSIVIQFVDENGADHLPAFGGFSAFDLPPLMSDLYDAFYRKQPPSHRLPEVI